MYGIPILTSELPKSSGRVMLKKTKKTETRVSSFKAASVAIRTSAVHQMTAPKNSDMGSAIRSQRR